MIRNQKKTPKVHKNYCDIIFFSYYVPPILKCIESIKNDWNIEKQFKQSEQEKGQPYVLIGTGF